MCSPSTAGAPDSRLWWEELVCVELVVEEEEEEEDEAEELELFELCVLEPVEPVVCVVEVVLEELELVGSAVEMVEV